MTGVSQWGMEHTFPDSKLGNQPFAAAVPSRGCTCWRQIRARILARKVRSGSSETLLQGEVENRQEQGEGRAHQVNSTSNTMFTIFTFENQVHFASIFGVTVK